MIKNYLNRILVIIYVAFPFTLNAEIKDGRPTMVIAPIVVTGSHIEKSEMNLFSHAIQMSAEDSLLYGNNSLSQSLRMLPQYQGSTNNEQDSNSGNGSAGINLKALGNLSTITLINGRRAGTNSAYGYQHGGFADINLIPLSAIKFTEISFDSSSVIYGSDSIAGTVNFHLDKYFTGSEVQSFYGNTAGKDAATTSFSFKQGYESEKHHLVLGAEYFERNALYARDRDISDNTDRRDLGGKNSGSSTYPGHITANGQFLLLNEGINAPNSITDYRSFDFNNDLFNYSAYAPAVPAQNRKSIWATSQHKLNKKVHAWTEFIYTDSIQYNGLAPAPWSNSTNSSLLAAAITSPHNPLSTPSDLTTIRYRSFELGNLNQTYTKDAYRLVAGLKGVLNDQWKWESALHRTSVYANTKYSGIADERLLIPKIHTGEFNIFARSFAKGRSSSGIEYDNEKALSESRTTANVEYKEHLNAVDMKLVGQHELFNKRTVESVIGLELRNEIISVGSDELFDNKANLGAVATSPFSANRNVQSLFGELLIPLLDDFTDSKHRLNLHLASRFENYQDEGIHPTTKESANNGYNSWDYKVGLLYSPNPSLSFHSSYGTSFRAPTLTESYAAPRIDYPRINDPAQNNSFSESVPTFVNGNPNLDPETATTFNIGTKITPSKLDGLELSINFYRTEKKDVIANASQFMVDENWAGQGAGFGTIGNYDPQAPYASKIFRNNSTGALTFVNSDNFNVANIKVEGLDTQARYVFKVPGIGQFRTDLGVNFFLKHDVQASPNSKTISYQGKFTDYRSDSIAPGAIPDYKGFVSLFWNHQGWTTGLTLNHIDGYSDDPNAVNGNSRNVASWTTLDAVLQYSCSQPDSLFSGMTFTMGLENLFDSPPPFVAGAFADGYDTASYDLRGRFYYFNLSKHF